MNILYLSPWFPLPANNGSKIRILNLLRGLSKHHQVTLFTFSQDEDYREYLPHLNACCRKILVAPRRKFDPHRLRAILGYLSSKPRSMVDMYSADMERLIRAEIGSQNGFDLVIFSEVDSLNYKFLFSGIPAILEDLELGALNYSNRHAKNLRQALSWKLMWWKTCRYLNSLLADIDAVTVVSEQEKEILKIFAVGSEKVHLIPNGIELSEYPYNPEIPEANQIVFSGSLCYPINHEAVSFFVAEIFPLLKRKIPSISLVITGDQEDLENLPGQFDPQITYTGYIDDVHRQITCCKVSIVPLKSGGGTRLKILESMALGTPVVTTAKGAEGLDVQNKVHLLIADTPDDFASAVADLLLNPDLHASIAANARILVESVFDWEKIMPKFLGILESVASGNDK